MASTNYSAMDFARSERERQYNREIMDNYMMFTWYPANTETKTDPQTAFKQLAKSVKEIEAEPFTGETTRRLENKILRLLESGATAQAQILEAEIETRNALLRLKEWDYKLLPREVIKKFSEDNLMTLTRDGLKLHIDLLGDYLGNPQSGEAKDRIIPDNVLDKLDEAKERKLFTGFSVLWAEKVKDPILLGIVNGCEDYFYICEWGDDITFEQIMEGKD